MSAAEHALFIIWSYVGVGVLTLALIVYVAWDSLRVKKQLADLEKSGVRPPLRRDHQHLNRGRILLALLPLVVLVGLIGVFAFSMNRDPALIRSVLIGKPAPAFALPAVAGTGVEGFDTASLKGEVTVVNVFASWCVPCRDEHPLLEVLKTESGVRLYGINQADVPENAAKFLGELGNPYDRIGGDNDRRVSIDWGVYGVPETFVVNADGVITYKHVGPMSPQSLETEVLPAVEKARAGTG